MFSHAWIRHFKFGLLCEILWFPFRRSSAVWISRKQSMHMPSFTVDTRPENKIKLIWLLWRVLSNFISEQQLSICFHFNFLIKIKIYYLYNFHLKIKYQIRRIIRGMAREAVRPFRRHSKKHQEGCTKCWIWSLKFFIGCVSFSTIFICF